jgi:hypothetical protein
MRQDIKRVTPQRHCWPGQTKILDYGEVQKTQAESKEAATQAQRVAIKAKEKAYTL